METTTDKGEQMIPPKGYKHTELGVLPEDWEVVRLGDVCEIQSGGTPSRNVKKYWENGTIKWLGSSVCKNQNRIDEITDYITEEGLKNSSAKIFSKGTTLIALVGATIGKVAYLPFEASTNQNIAGLQPNKQVANDKFIFYSSLMLYRHFETLSSDKFKMANLSFVRNLQIPLPPLAEQEKIAEILSAWDTQIQNFETLIAEKQNLKKGLCQTLLTAKTRLKGFSGDWEMKEFKKIFKRIPSKKFQIQTKDYKKIGKYPIVDQGKAKIVAYSDCDEKVLRVSDVILFGDHTREVKYINFDFIVGADGVQLFRSFSENNLFLYYFLSSQHIPNTGYNRHFKFVESMLFPLPPLTEQEKIAEILSEADNEITLLEQKLESLKSQKRGLMQKLLNGKVRVKR